MGCGHHCRRGRERAGAELRLVDAVNREAIDAEEGCDESVLAIARLVAVDDAGLPVRRMGYRRRRGATEQSGQGHQASHTPCNEGTRALASARAHPHARPPAPPHHCSTLRPRSAKPGSRKETVLEV